MIEKVFWDQNLADALGGGWRGTPVISRHAMWVQQRVQNRVQRYPDLSNITGADLMMKQGVREILGSIL